MGDPAELLKQLPEGTKVVALMKSGDTKRLSVEYVTSDDTDAWLAYIEVDGDGEEILPGEIESATRVVGE